MGNSKLEEFKRYIRNRKVAFIGIGVSNIPAMKYLSKMGANVTGFDKKTYQELGDICIELESMGIGLSLGEKYLETLMGYDVIFRSPTVRPDMIQIQRELKMGAVLTSEIEMVMKMCPGTIIGVTGSGGKTTTSTLIYNMLSEQGKDCYLGGNIGVPLFDKIEEMNEDTIVVLELSSFQLMTMNKSPHIAVMTSLAPDHLDIHTSLEEYYDAKTNIFKYQNEDDILILNYDNEILREYIPKAKGRVRLYSQTTKLDTGVIVADEKIKIANNKVRRHIIDCNEIAMVGKYNQMNLCAAVLATDGIVDIENVAKVARTFTGVHHRMELVAVKDKVKYINNSIASSPIKSITSIQDIEQKIILLAGGYDKHVDFEDFAKTIIEKAKVVFLFGQTKYKIKEAIDRQLEEINSNLEVVMCDNFDIATKKAIDYAVEGDMVILSPGCASFDEFKNYQERGNRFKEIIESY